MPEPTGTTLENSSDETLPNPEDYFLAPTLLASSEDLHLSSVDDLFKEFISFDESTDQFDGFDTEYRKTDGADSSSAAIY